MLNKIFNAKILLIVFMLTCISLLSGQIGNEDAVYFKMQHEYILNSDGTVTYNYGHQIKLFTSFAFTRQYGESFIIYNPDLQKLTVTKSNTTMADGKVFESPFNAYNEVLPRFAANAAPYLNLREMVVTHIGLEKDCMIDFAYTIVSKKGMYPGLIGKQIIGDRAPIDNMIVIVKVPKDKSLNYFLTTGEYEPVKTKEAGYDVYTWNFENLPLVEVEEGQHSMEEFVPTLYFGSTPAQNVVDYILRDASSHYLLPASAIETVKEITKDKESKLCKAFAIHEYIHSLIGSMNGDLIYTGYKPIKAADVFTRNAGSKLDKAILLAAMLKSIDIKAEPVLVSKSSIVKEDLSLLCQFENTAVMCEGLLPNGENLFLDPDHSQDNFYPSFMIGKYFAVLDKDALVKAFTTGLLNQNSINLKGEFTLNGEGSLSGKLNFDINGYFNNNRCSKKLTASIVKSFKSSGATLVFPEENNFDAKINNFKSSADMTMTCTKNETTGIWELSLPQFKGGVNDLHIPMNKSKRTTPVFLPVDFSEEYNYTITLPDNYLPAVTPAVINISNSVGEVNSTVALEGNELKVAKKINIKNAKVEAAQYSELYDLIAGWNDKYHKILYIQ